MSRVAIPKQSDNSVFIASLMTLLATTITNNVEKICNMLLIVTATIALIRPVKFCLISDVSQCIWLLVEWLWFKKILKYLIKKRPACPLNPARSHLTLNAVIFVVINQQKHWILRRLAQLIPVFRLHCVALALWPVLSIWTMNAQAQQNSHVFFETAPGVLKDQACSSYAFVPHRLCALLCCRPHRVAP